MPDNLPCKNTLAIQKNTEVLTVTGTVDGVEINNENTKKLD